VLTGLHLPLRFDVERLRADLAVIDSSEWAAHYNTNDYGGEWRGAALRSSTGSATELAAVAAGFQDTALLSRCPYFREVLAAFECPLKSVRLLSLSAGSFIREHSDNALDYEDGEVRLHVPVQTNPDVEFYLSGERLLLEEGRAYYVNVNLPHRVNNRGTADRIHLVIDAEVNDWVRELFARSPEIPRCAPPPRGVERFRDAAIADPGLADRLRAIGDALEFAVAAVRLGQAAGFDFHEGDVDALLKGVARPGAAGGIVCGFEARSGRPYLTWADAGDRSYSEPFYEDTVRAVLRTPWGKFSRRVAPLGSVAAPPRGFIFHISRCGSTLVSQMLKAAGYRVVSEAAVVDAALRSDAEWLPAVIGALGAEFVKFDAWHIHEFETIRALFPRTPWIFVHRDTAGVLASQRRSPGLHALPGAMEPKVLQMTIEDVTTLDREAWTARVIGKMRASAERHRGDPMGLFVDYRDLPDAVWRPVARHFGLDLTAGQVESMREAARFDAKTPRKVWTATAPDTP
jgi:hypothetical protein